MDHPGSFDHSADGSCFAGDFKGETDFFRNRIRRHDRLAGCSAAKFGNFRRDRLDPFFHCLHVHEHSDDACRRHQHLFRLDIQFCRKELHGLFHIGFALFACTRVRVAAVDQDRLEAVMLLQDLLIVLDRSRFDFVFGEDARNCCPIREIQQRHILFAFLEPGVDTRGLHTCSCSHTAFM